MLGKLDTHMQKNEIGPLPYIIHKKSLQNLRSETIKLLEENIREKCHDTGLSNDFLCAKSTDNKSKSRWMRLHQIKIFCTAQETINRVKRQPMEKKKIIANHISAQGLISKIPKELGQLKSKKTNNLIKPWDK